MDTVEWGSGRNRTPGGSAPVGPGGLPMPSPIEQVEQAAGGSRLSFRGRWVTPVLAGLGLAALLAAEFLPWVSLKIASTSNTTVFGSNVDPSSNGTAVGIDVINTFSAFSYRLGLFAMLAVAGAMQFGRLTQRRRLVGFAVGLIAAESFCVIGAIRSLGQMAGLEGLSQQTARTHTVMEPGAYLAIAGLALILASVLLSVAPARVQARLADAVREPDDAQFTDEPIELTVTQVKPLDEAHWTRPDPRHR